ncbi:phosphotransferase [bacterium]|nr:phosphotransferase [bacterium]
MDWERWVGARLGRVRESSLIQRLWGGYGDLRRVYLENGTSVILKLVRPPQEARLSASDRRKRLSYEVERAWYLGPARQCDERCRVARLLEVERAGEICLMLLEDLANAGYAPGRPPNIGAGLSWLAHFHRRFLGSRPEGLWEQGGYWHLETRQDELNRMPAGPLKDSAGLLDRCLRRARFQTLIHGDSKPANFLWHGQGRAAAVDFQYVGVGCGIRDVAYYLDCCLSHRGAEAEIEDWLDFYFRELAADPELESEWRRLFPVAWIDYARFYQGWGRGDELGPFSRELLGRALSIVQAEEQERPR